MEDLFNSIIIIISGMRHEQQALQALQAVRAKYAFSKYTTESFVTSGSEKTHIQLLINNDNNIRIRYYIKNGIIKLWHVTFKLKDMNDMNDISDKLCSYYNLRKKQICGDDKIAKYDLKKDNVDPWNISIVLQTDSDFIVPRSELVITNRHIDKNDKFCLVVS
jgi:hypothetical protein